MSTIVTRAGKGSPLTWNEVDTNFTNLNNDKLQSGSTVAALTITSATINGGTITGTALNGTLGATTPSTVAATTISASGVSTFSAGSAGAPAITTAGDTNTGMFFPAADTIAFSEGGAESMRIDSSGNVGIGTASPTTKLQVDGGASDTYVRIVGQSSNLYLGQDATGTQILSDRNAPMLFSTNNTEKMRLDAIGNLGIGVTPSAWGSLMKAVEFSGGCGVSVYNGIASYINSNTYWNGTNWLFKTGSGSGKAQQFIADSNSGAFSWQQASGGTAGNAITFTQAMTLDASGNLGIGTTSPSAKLHIAGTGTQSTLVQSTNGGTTSLRLLSSGAYERSIENSSGGLKFIQDATEFMRLDASGNLGIGVTPSAWGSGVKALQINAGVGIMGDANNYYVLANSYYDGTNFKYINSSFALNHRMAGGNYEWYTAPSGTAGATVPFTERMKLNVSGNLGIGCTPSPVTLGKVIEVGNTANGLWNASTADTRLMTNVYYDSGTLKYGSTNVASMMETGAGFVWRTAPSGTAGTAITFTAAMTLDASNNLLIGTTTNTDNSKTNIQFTGSATNGLVVKNLASSGNPSILFLHDSAQALNNTSNCASYQDSSVQRWILRKNGGLANYSANNVNLSDERTKKDIVDAGSYIDKICAIPVRTFLYKDQTDDLLNLGVIAQEVEAIAPELVDVSGFGETPEDGEPLKAIYQTDLQYALMKCIQELKAELDITKAKVAALEAA